MATTFIAYLLIVLFLVGEGRLRQGEQARSLDESREDRGSTRRIGAAFGVSALAVLAAPVLNLLRIGTLPEGVPLGWIGVAVMLAGIGLRAWAAIVLGRFYTRTLVTADDQHLVQQGPYRLIRHPGYLGTILLWIGAGLATANAIAVVVVTAAVVIAYAYRIQSEEAMLLGAFGQKYRDYMHRTWRLIPPLY